MGFRSVLVGAALVAAAPGCTVVRVDAEEGPSRLESSGLLDGHAAIGWRADDDVLRLKVLEGASPGAIGEFSLWKLFRLELGLLGVGVGVGPFDVALGVVFYDPDLPAFVGQEPGAAAPEEHGDCPVCAQLERDGE